MRREGRDTIENRQKEIAGSLPRNPAFILVFWTLNNRKFYTKWFEIAVNNIASK